jgi:flagella basal body P-ring formation protein FlgA
MTRQSSARRGVILALLGALSAAPAFAGTPVTLNAHIVDATGHVTLGELFDPAGPARDVLVAVQSFARRYGLDWDNPTGLSRIIVRAEVTGLAAGQNRDILTYAHSLTAGQIVQGSDLIWAKAAAAPVDAAPSVDGVIGMAARRPLREGDPVLVRDVSAPLVIKSGETVDVTYADDGVVLTLQAKALANAAVGDTLNVLNTASKKLIEVMATGPDQAVVGPEAQRLKAERNPAQIALR